jgi:DNA-binding response OmpR family regulator
VTLACSEIPNLILLDLKSCFDICRMLKRNFVTEPIPIIALLSPAEEVDRVAAFELGADDCMAKPYSFRELTLRIRCSLDRVKAPWEGWTAEAEGLLAVVSPDDFIARISRWFPLAAEPKLFPLEEVVAEHKPWHVRPRMRTCSWASRGCAASATAGECRVRWEGWRRAAIGRFFSRSYGCRAWAVVVFTRWGGCLEARLLRRWRG